MLPLPVKVEGVFVGTLPWHIGSHRQWATASQAGLAPCTLNRGRCGLRSYALNRMT